MKNKIENKITEAKLSESRIKGYVGNVADSFIYNRLASDFARMVIYQETEDAFKNQIDDEQLPYIWQGEFWGKWIISACRCCTYQNDPVQREFIRNATHNFLNYQREDGYIGTYKNSLNVFEPDPIEIQKVMSWPCKWNWNIWCRKYTLWGLVEVYKLTHDDVILNAACSHASFLINELHENDISLSDTGTFVGFPSCSILKPLLLLYKESDNKKYLDFALSIADGWEDKSGKAPNLITNAFSGLPVHQWYDNPEDWAKAYEIMSCLEGLLELYRVTGIEKYLKVVENIHELLQKYEDNTVCSVGFNDMFAGGSEQINSLSEPCDVIHWCRITYDLFALTGDVKYLDVYERSFYNALLAGVENDRKWGDRCVRSSNIHLSAPEQAKMKHSHCCVNNMPRAFMDMAEVAVMHDEGGIYINLFTDYETKIIFADSSCATVSIFGEYLARGIVKIKVSGSFTMPLALNIRIPAWSKETVITLNGKTRKISERAVFYKGQIDPGENEATVVFDQNPRIVDFDKEVAVYPEKDFRYARWATAQEIPDAYHLTVARSMVYVGPLLLARSKRIGNTEEEMFTRESIFGKGYKITKIAPFFVDADIQASFKVELSNGKDTFETNMCDYAASGNDNKKDNAYFTIYI